MTFKIEVKRDSEKNEKFEIRKSEDPEFNLRNYLTLNIDKLKDSLVKLEMHKNKVRIDPTCRSLFNSKNSFGLEQSPFAAGRVEGFVNHGSNNEVLEFVVCEVEKSFSVAYKRNIKFDLKGGLMMRMKSKMSNMPELSVEAIRSGLEISKDGGYENDGDLKFYISTFRVDESIGSDMNLPIYLLAKN